MRIFFDHNVPEPLLLVLEAHAVATAKEHNWHELANGRLLRAVEDDGYQVFITCDQGIFYQQNLTGRQLAIVLLTRNNWRLVKQRVMQISAAIDRATPGSFQIVDCHSQP